MKRLITWTILGILAVTTPAVASPVGRPVAREKSWTAAVLVSNESLDFENQTAGLTGDLRSNAFLIDGAYAFTHNAEFFLRLGLSDDQYNRTGTGAGEIDLGSGASWGLGIRGSLYDSYQGWKIMGDLQYAARPGRDMTNAELDITEAQLALGIEIKSGPFYPYGGLLGNTAEIKSNNNGAFPNAKLETHLGAYLGVGFEPYERWTGYIEGRFASGAAATLGVQYRF